MKKERIIFGASLFTIAFSFNVNAQTCGTPPTCASLGYMQTASDCPASGVKCPFDTTKMYCAETCQIGSVLNSDKTCTKKFVPGKTPIAVVFHPGQRLALSLRSLPALEWATGNGLTASIPGLECKNGDVNGCEHGKANTAIIKAFGEQHKIFYPAITGCLDYYTGGTQKGDWFLPSIKELEWMCGNPTNLASIKATLKNITDTSGGLVVDYVCGGEVSSNEAFSSRVYKLDASQRRESFPKSYVGPVRPMIQY